MIFPYQKITSKIKRPIIPIFLKSQKKFIFYSALVDSGADYCVFSTEIANALGVKLARKAIYFRGMGKGKIRGRWGTVEIKIGKNSYTLKAIFAEIGEFGHGILGQQGFFDHFDVKLSYTRGIIEVNSSNGIN